MVTNQRSVCMEKVELKKPVRSRRTASSKKRRSFDKAFKIRAVRLYEEDGHTVHSICEKIGVSSNSYYRWLSEYRAHGESAFEASRSATGKRGIRIPTEVREKILSQKTIDPRWGLQKIVDNIRYHFHLPVSTYGVRKVLTENGTPPIKKRARPKKNAVKPRRFERSTPNQMWQSDIMMIRMGGRQLYLVGYIDDYSRYIVGLELFQQQTADNVLEVYLRASTEYSPPREMLTDNGRQYVNWRGETKFQKQMKKDKISHIRSQPHHPMTLGKIERFWQTILSEFFDKARFESLEEARNRIRQWVQYYNYKRPHQGIGGLCPADRYFEVAHELRKTIEQGIEENIQELALRGKARKPFYLLGRMGTKDVVLRANKGKLTFRVNEDEVAVNDEQSFDFEEAWDGEDGVDNRETENDPEVIKGVQRSSAGGGSPENLGGTADTCTDLSRTGDNMDYIKSVGEESDGGNAAGARTPCSTGSRDGIESTASESACETAVFVSCGSAETEAEECDEKFFRGRVMYGKSGKSEDATGGHSESPQRIDDGDGGRVKAWCIEEDLLRMGGAGPFRDDYSIDRPGRGQACTAGRSGEGGYEEGNLRDETRTGASGKSDDPSEVSGRLRTAAEAALIRFGYVC